MAIHELEENFYAIETKSSVFIFDAEGKMVELIQFMVESAGWKLVIDNG